MRTGVEPALDSFGILPATVCVMSPFSEGCQLSVLPIEHTAHRALIIGSVRKAFRFHKPPLASYSGISRTPSIFSRALPQIICFSGASLLLLPPSHCTVLHSASDTVWYTEKPGAYVPHVFILRSVAVVAHFLSARAVHG